jgi:serine/threonine protein kinase
LYRERKSGKRIVIKFWQGSLKDLHYFALLHEADTIKALTSVQSKLGPAKSKGFIIPKFIQSGKYKNGLYLISEFFQGRSISDLSDRKKYTIFKDCLQFLNELGKVCDHKHKSKISTKGIFDYIFLYPLLLVSVYLRHAELRNTIFKGVPVFLSGIPKILQWKSSYLVHGDLNPNNILISGKKLAVLDVEQMRFSYQEYELVTTLCIKKYSNNFKNMIVRDLLRKKMDKKAIATLLVNASTHNLTDNPKKDSVANYLNVFNLGLKFNNNI